MRGVVLVPVFLAVSAFGQRGEVRGVVRDGRGGEPLARVDVRLLDTGFQTVTDGEGVFRLPDLPPGTYVLDVSTVHYRTERREFSLEAGESKEFEVILNSNVLRQVETVEASTGPFDPERSDSPSVLTLSGSETQNLAGVLLGDPLRAVQGLPGVATGDDFSSFFVLRGASFHRVGIYLDEVLLHSPFHTMRKEQTGGSVTLFNTDALDSINLYSGGYASRFQDRGAGALELQTREGNRGKVRFRGSAGVSSVSLVADGPLGRTQRGSWLVGARKSYLQYLISRVSEEAANEGAVDFTDVEGRIDYHVGRRNSFTLSVIDGGSDFNRTDPERLGINELYQTRYHVTVANLGWRVTPAERVSILNRAAYERERFDNVNRVQDPLAVGYYGEWIYQGSALWAWSQANPLEAGWSVRWQREDGTGYRYRLNPAWTEIVDRYAGTGIRSGGYLQQSLGVREGKVVASVGARWDAHSPTEPVAVSPTASLALAPAPSTRLSFAWGLYTQFPELAQIYSENDHPPLLPERSIHLQAALEQRLGERTRVRVEAYQRLDRDLLLLPFYDPRLVDGKVYTGSRRPRFFNSGRGYGRGVEVFLQRRSANRLSGWISYALSYSRLCDGVAGTCFDSDFDQRHTTNVFGNVRVRPTVSLSAKYRYGSGFPIPGYLEQRGAEYYVTTAKNLVRIDPYHRLDFRVNKAFNFRRLRMNLYVEVVNLLNNDNVRFEDISSVNPVTGQVRVQTQELFPIFPAAGVTVEF